MFMLKSVINGRKDLIKGAKAIKSQFNKSVATLADAKA